MSAPWKEYVLGFSVLMYGWETYLNLRQHRKLLERLPPPQVKTLVSTEDFSKARDYGLDKSNFGFIKDIFSILETAAIFIYDILPWLWDFSGRLLARWGYGEEYEIVHSLVFLAFLTYGSSIIHIPFDLYSTFVIEQRHGFNKQTLSLYISDYLKTSALTAVIGAPVVAAFLWIVKWAGTGFAFWVWLFMFFFQLILITIYPTFIQPLFNKFTPLEDGELKKKIDDLAARIKFPLTKLFVIDGSKRSSHSNAYFFGFFKNKRIVLFDTLLEQSTHEEILGVLAHELGHWQYNHVMQMLAVIQFHLFVLFYAFGYFIDFTPLYRSFGFNTQPILIGFLLFNYIYGPLDTIMSFIQNLISRKNEFQADAFAKKLGYTEVLKSGLIKLHIKNKGNLNPDHWYSAWHYSHPPLVERLEALGKAE
ncbi:CAAX prenyl protease 1 [Rhizophlyctis rosea]|nr:CAAX prenyl protease 1 [Rhizophlyctis rosea]